MSRWRHILVFFTVKDVNTNERNFGVTVLAGFGGGHVDDFAWVAFHHAVTVLSEGGTLDWVDVGTGGAGVKVVIFEVRHIKKLVFYHWLSEKGVV